MSTTLRTVYSARRLPLKLGAIAAVLSALHVAVMVIHYRVVEIHWLIRDLFDLDEEQSFGTWFSVVLLLFVGYILLLHARERRAAGDAWQRWWQVLGLGFTFLSLDEMVGLHESFNTAVDFSWTIPGAVVAAFVGGAFLPFLQQLPRRTSRRFVIAGVLYLGGAIGIEFATEPMAELDLLDTLEYNLTTMAEEALEMAGVIFFLHALLAHIAHPQDKVAAEVKVDG